MTVSAPRLRSFGLALLLLATAACADTPDSDEPSETDAPAAAPASDAGSMSVTIVEPADGAEVAGPDVTVRFETSGVRIVAAGDTTAGTGHHHLFLDTDLSEAGQPIPTVPGSVIHIGTGASEYVLTGVAPGEHTLIAVVGDGVHVPLQPWVVDTVRFTVR